MAHEKLISEFIEKIRAAAGANLVSVILYGSGAEGEFHPEYSDLNLLCVLRDASFASLSKIAEVVEWWRGKKHHPPLVLTLAELKASADTFSIEFMDMKQRHRVLYGEDVLGSSEYSDDAASRASLSMSCGKNCFCCASILLVAGSDEKQLWEVMLQFVVVVHYAVPACTARNGRAGPQAFARGGRRTGPSDELRSRPRSYR